jgi:hypothetical protein
VVDTAVVCHPTPTAVRAFPERGRWGRLAAAAGPAAGIVLALWLVAPVLGGRPPAGEDVMSHLVRADFGIAHLVAHGRLDGWFPRFFLGHQEFLFNGPGLTCLMALARGLCLGALSNTGALKVVGIAAFVAIPPAVCFLARSYGLSREAAGLAAVFSLLVSSPFGPGLQGLYRIGLVPHQVGAEFFCLALGSFVRLLTGRDTGRHRRYQVLAAGSVAVILVTHVITALVLATVLGITMLLVALTGGLTRSGTGRVVAAGLGGAGLAGFWLVPFLAHNDLSGVLTTWDTPPLASRLADVLTGRVLLPQGVAVVMAAGWLWALRRRRNRPDALLWAATPLAYVLVAHGALRVIGGNDLTLQLPNRGLGYAGLLGILSLGALGASLSRRLGAPGHLLAVALAVVVVAITAPGKYAAGQLPEAIPEMRAAAAELARLVPDGARFATERDFPWEISRTGAIHPEIWLARASGRDSLNGYNPESSSTPAAAFEPDRLHDQATSVSADHLARLGVTHVVATTDALADDLASSGRFTPVWHAHPLSILAVQPRLGDPPPASLVGADAGTGVSARLVRASAEHLGIDVGPPAPATISVALAWSPKWHGHLDGAPIALGRTGEGLVQVDLPAGSHRLALDYRSDGWDRLGLAITALTLLAGLAVVVLGRRARCDPKVLLPRNPT